MALGARDRRRLLVLTLVIITVPFIIIIALEPDRRHIDLLGSGRYFVSINIYQSTLLTRPCVASTEWAMRREENLPPKFLRPRPRLTVMFDVVWKGNDEHILQLSEVIGRTWT